MGHILSFSNRTDPHNVVFRLSTAEWAPEAWLGSVVFSCATYNYAFKPFQLLYCRKSELLLILKVEILPVMKYYYSYLSNVR
jgi:hypothetical protein